MNLEETLKLIDAGFSADEIRALAKEKEGGDPADTEGKPAETGEPAEEVTDTGANADVKALNETIQKLSDTVSKMQEQNIKNARTGSADVHTDPIKEKMDEFIKGL